MSDIIKELYERLARDYLDHKKESFLYQYLKNHHKITDDTAEVPKAVRDFFRNAGYSFRPTRFQNRHPDTALDEEEGYEEYDSVTEHLKNVLEPLPNRARKKDNTLSLLQKYYERIGKTSLFTPEPKIPDPEMMDALYDFLNNDKNKNYDRIRIPLIVDHETGCSLELVGKSYYPRSKKDKERIQNHEAVPACAYLVYVFEESPKGYGMYGRAIGADGATARYDTYDEARVFYDIERDYSLKELEELNAASSLSGMHLSDMSPDVRDAYALFFPNIFEEIKMEAEQKEQKAAWEGLERADAEEYANAEPKDTPAMRRRKKAAKQVAAAKT